MISKRWSSGHHPRLPGSILAFYEKVVEVVIKQYRACLVQLPKQYIFYEEIKDAGCSDSHQSFQTSHEFDFRLCIGLLTCLLDLLLHLDLLLVYWITLLERKIIEAHKGWEYS